MEEKDSLTFKNYQLNAISYFLDYPMHGEAVRARAKFLKLISPQIREIAEERSRLRKELAEKDEKGEPKMKEGGKEFDLTPDNEKKFKEDFLVLLNEDYIVDILPSNKAAIKEAKKLLEKTTREVLTEDGMIYDAVLDAFEK